MKAVTIHDAKTNLSKYIAAAKRGEKIYIGGFGKPEVQLSVVPEKNKSGKRRLGLGKGKIWVATDAFSEETDKDIADMLLRKNDELGL